VELVVRPIAFVRSPFVEKAEAPRQAACARGVVGSVEVLPAYRDALEDLEGFDRVWLLFWFDRAEGWRPKVLPPRSERRRGVFATRSPHRPNPIGMSAVQLVRVEDLVLHVRELDLIDGTPVLDIKPYIPYADAFPDARSGWLEQPPAETTDPRAMWSVAFEPAAEEALSWIARETGLDVKGRIVSSLALGPQAHAYRRIKRTEGGGVLAVKEWRARFRVEAPAERRILVDAIESGYRARDLATGKDPVHAVHRAFVTRPRPS
jgi:tRNA-Thr(GGU) m(6)t(6)A37 methyltransferase TsaA